LEIEKTAKIIRKIAKKKNCGKQITWEPELHKAVREAAIKEAEEVEHIGAGIRAPVKRRIGKSWLNKKGILYHYHTVKETELDELSKEKLLNYIDKSGQQVRSKTASPKRVKGNEKAFDKYMTKRFHEGEEMITENWDKMFSTGHRKEAASHRDELHEEENLSPIMERYVQKLGEGRIGGHKTREDEKDAGWKKWKDEMEKTRRRIQSLPPKDKKVTKETYGLPQDLIDAAAKIGEDQSQFNDAASQDAKSQGQATPKKGKKNLGVPSGKAPVAPTNMG
jgi:hypothetical protein